MNNRFVAGPSRLTLTLVSAGLLGLGLAGCGSLGSGDDKVDYRSQAGKTSTLDIPPDLTQMAREGRYLPRSGVVTASDLRNTPQAVPAAATGGRVAPASAGDVRLVREGQTRWLVTSRPPEQVFPLLRRFWTDHGFVLDTDSPEIGVLETDWAENRAKLPQDVLRRTLGRVLDSLYSTGERDRFRTRVERRADGGSEIYVTHRGMAEVFASEMRERTVWQPRPRDPELETEFLSRIMVALGAPEGAARMAASQPSSTPPAGSPAAPVPAAPRSTAAPLPATANLEVPQPFERAWRSVGLALDRNGFTVEDRDRNAGLYFVRYVDPRSTRQEEPNFLQRLFGNTKEVRPVRYRILLQPQGQGTRVSVQNSDGQADNSEGARSIAGRLAEFLQAP